MKTCKGRLGAEDVARLEKAIKSEGFRVRDLRYIYLRGMWSEGLHAREYVGVWYPESHDPPPRKRKNPSGKPGYYEG
jgi:hypothetical protein